MTTDTMSIVWSKANPEEILDIRWKGSQNLTMASPHENCPSGGDLAFFGNSWAESPFASLVGWGTTGTWSGVPGLVEIESSSAGCPGSLGVDVDTRYAFGDGPGVDQFRVTRTFDFGAEAFMSDFLPYSPRLSPNHVYTTVLHPDVTGTALRSELHADCEFGCLVNDWDGTWYAVHSPSTGQGLIVQHHPSFADIALWVDQDAGTDGTTRTSVLFEAPPAGFSGQVSETLTMCFYDSARWSAAMQQSLTLPSECQLSGAFFDDNGNTFESDIEWLADSGITKGCNPPANTEFCPDEFVTRGQMAAFLVRALGYTDDGGGNLFTDDNGNTFEGDIDKLATAGVTKGCNPPANDRYCPNELVTRGQMAAFLVRAMGYTDDGAGDLFVDDDGSTFEADIDRLGTAEVTKGCNPPANDEYCPNDFVTRGQMAAFLRRALQN